MNSLRFDQIKIGSEFSFEKTITDQDMEKFLDITGDNNPLHTDIDFAKQKGFDNKVVYGLLAGSLFSTLIGVHCPGKNALYLSQSFQFKKPIFPNQKLLIKGIVKEKNDSIKTITITTTIETDGQILTSGQALAKVL